MPKKTPATNPRDLARRLRRQAEGRLSEKGRVQALHQLLRLGPKVYRFDQQAELKGYTFKADGEDITRGAVLLLLALRLVEPVPDGRSPGSVPGQLRDDGTMRMGAVRLTAFGGRLLQKHGYKCDNPDWRRHKRERERRVAPTGR